jgi:hypothetical protein
VGAGSVRTLHARTFGVTPEAFTDTTTEFVLCSTCGWHNQSLSFFIQFITTFRVSSLQKLGPGAYDNSLIYNQKSVFSSVLLYNL